MQPLVWEDSRRAACGVTQNRGGHGGVRGPTWLALGHGDGLLVIRGSMLLPTLWSHKKSGHSMELKTLATAKCLEIPRNLSFTNQSCRHGAAGSAITEAFQMRHLSLWPRAVPSSFLLHLGCWCQGSGCMCVEPSPWKRKMAFSH